MHYVGRIGVALVIALAAYLFVYRPRQLHWGATDDEVARAIPGDEIQLQPVFNATRAVTIHARPEQVWLWLMQIGYKRGGWYGYDLIDNAGIPSANRILPEWQHLKVGDTVPIWKGINFKVAAVEPNRWVVWESESGHDSMALALYPIGASGTRLVWRIRNAPYNWTAPYIVIQLFAHLSDFIAVRQNMLGIMARAEGVAPESAVPAYAELVLWLSVFFGFLVAELGVVARRDWLRPLLAAPATALITVALVLSKPPIWVDGLAAIGSCVGLWWMYRPPACQRSRRAECPA